MDLESLNLAGISATGIILIDAFAANSDLITLLLISEGLELTVDMSRRPVLAYHIYAYAACRPHKRLKELHDHDWVMTP